MLSGGPSAECNMLKKQAFFCIFLFLIIEMTLYTTLRYLQLLAQHISQIIDLNFINETGNSLM